MKNKSGVLIGLVILIIIVGFIMTQNKPAPQDEGAGQVSGGAVSNAEKPAPEESETSGSKYDAADVTRLLFPPAETEASGDAAAHKGPFHIGVATLTVSQAEDTYRAAEHLIGLYGNASEGGMIRHVTMPDSFMSEMETTITQIVGLSDDPLVKVIVVDDAIPGTTEAFRRVKEKRPDILCFAGEPQEDPGVIGPVADLAIYADNIARGYLIIHTAKELGAKKFVHISFPRHMGYELLARRRAIMEEACKELGLEFIFETAPDPTSDVGVPGAQQFILEQVPNWVQKYGKETAFFCTNDAQTEPLLAQVAKNGAIFVEPDLPSPLMGYPGAFGIDLKAEAGDWPAILKKVEAAVDKAGGSERMGTWAYSYGWSTTCALAEYGKNIVEGAAKLGKTEDIWAAYSKFTPGAEWNGSVYTDISTGSVMRNLILVYQDTYVFGKGYMGVTKVNIPEKYLTNIAGNAEPKPAPEAADKIHIGILTGTVSQSEDDLRGAEEMIRLYGDADSGGMIKHVTYPDNFMTEMETTISQIAGMADDPQLKVIVINQAIPGATEGFRRVKERRPDIICIAGEAHEDPNVIASVADLTVNADFVSRGYLIPHTAKELGLKTFVHISFPRHMSYETLGRRRAIMEEACKDLGIKFVFETAPDPTSDVGVAGAQQFILEKVPGWIEQYGKDTAFFCTNDAHTEPLLRQIAQYGGYFIEADLPSPLMGYPGAFGIDLEGLSGDWPAILKKVEAAVSEKGAGGRMGTWAYSLGFCHTAGLAEFGKLVAEGKAKITDTKTLLECYGKFSPGAKWNGSFYVDASTKRPMRNFFLIYQDTYMMGKGYMGVTDIAVPDKYLNIQFTQSN